MASSLLPITSFERGIRRFAPVLAAMLCWGAGCAVDMHNQPFVGRSTETTELLSNLPETRFYTRLRKVDADPDEGWKLEGQGKRVAAELRKGGRYEIKATHEGYKDKFCTLTEPIPRCPPFKFVDADRIGPVVLAQPPMTVTPTPTPTPVTAPPVRPRRESGTSVIAQRWAVVIGISDYEHSGTAITDLRYAERDATAFHSFLLSKAGGGFDASRVASLTDKQATKGNITKALFSFLKRTVAEDLVIIFFSGHGAPDPDKPENLYLLTYDTDPSDISGTAFPMWDLERALKRTIDAERVVVFADACHSAGLGGDVGERAIGRSTGNKINQYFQKLAETKPGRVIFTSSEGYEVSRESPKWGGGHGVFTWALLEGLRGKADGFAGSKPDGIVTLGEILDFVDRTVRRETSNEQHPSKTGGRFDRDLPLGIVEGNGGSP